MNNEEYLMVQNKILTVTALVQRIPLDEFIQAAEKADTVGPFVDPTLWREGHANLEWILKVARVLREFQAKVQMWSKSP